MTDWVKNGLEGVDFANLTARQLAIARNEMAGAYKTSPFWQGMPRKGNGRNTRYDFWKVGKWALEKERLLNEFWNSDKSAALMEGLLHD